MSAHTFPTQEPIAEDARCIHCGTLQSQTQRTACPGSQSSAPPPSGMRPEPSERRYAVYDQATIAARLIELRAEREAAWNVVEEETGG